MKRLGRGQDQDQNLSDIHIRRQEIDDTLQTAAQGVASADRGFHV